MGGLIGPMCLRRRNSDGIPQPPEIHNSEVASVMTEVPIIAYRNRHLTPSVIRLGESVDNTTSTPETIQLPNNTSIRNRRRRHSQIMTETAVMTWQGNTLNTSISTQQVRLGVMALVAMVGVDPSQLRFDLPCVPGPIVPSVGNSTLSTNLTFMVRDVVILTVCRKSAYVHSGPKEWFQFAIRYRWFGSLLLVIVENVLRERCMTSAFSDDLMTLLSLHDTYT